MRQLVDVDAARRDVGCHQHLQAAILEFRQRLGTRRLALVAVDRHRADAVLAQLFHQLVGAMLGARKHQHLVPVVRLDQVRQHRVLLVAVHRVDFLRDHFHGRVAARDLDRLRIVQQAVGQRLDVVREGGREQQVLAPQRQQGQHLADVVDEAHVQHAVGFVQDQDLDLRQVDRALARVVQQAARGRDQDVDAVLEQLDLRIDADAAEDHGRVQVGVLAVQAHAFLDLGRELAGRGQHQGADDARRGLVALGGAHGVVRQAVQDRQGEAGGLAGAGLCAGQQVATVQDGGNGLALDRGRGGITLFGHRAHDRVRETK